MESEQIEGQAVSMHIARLVLFVQDNYFEALNVLLVLDCFSCISPRTTCNHAVDPMTLLLTGMHHFSSCTHMQVDHLSTESGAFEQCRHSSVPTES